MIRFLGTGMYVPDRILTNADLEKMVDTSDEWITTRTGIKERHIVSDEQATSDLAAEAGLKAVENAGLSKEDIGVLIVATATPDMFFPSTACLAQHKMGLEGIPAFDISAACTGFIYGIAVAQGFISSGFCDNVLVIGAEALTRFTDWEDRTTCVLFGDGAGAAVFSKANDTSGVLGVHLGADGSLGDLLKLPAGGTRMPAAEETVKQRMHFVKMKGNEVFKHAVRNMVGISRIALEKAGVSAEDIKWLVPHQANIRIMQAVARNLGIPEEKVYVNIHKYGNMSAATIPIAIDEINRDGKVEKGDLLLLTSFGAGFTWGACVVKW